jgi:hypothetical protein
MTATEAEVIALNRDLAARLAARDAREQPVAPPTAAPEPAPGEDWSFLPPNSAARQYANPTLKLVVGFVEPVLETVGNLTDAIGKLRRENQELRIALAELRAEHAETKGKLGETAHTVERLTIDRTGPKGERGPPGADGKAGAIGPRGEKGSRGQRGFEIVGWKVDVAAYQAVPVFYDNSEGPPLNLRPFFERYNVDTEGDEIDLAVEQAAHSRAALELQTELVRRGLPAK